MKKDYVIDKTYEDIFLPISRCKYLTKLIFPLISIKLEKRNTLNENIGINIS